MTDAEKPAETVPPVAGEDQEVTPWSVSSTTVIDYNKFGLIISAQYPLIARTGLLSSLARSESTKN